MPDIKAPANPLSDEDPCPSLQTAVFSIVSSSGGEQREEAGSVIYLFL